MDEYSQRVFNSNAKPWFDEFYVCIRISVSVIVAQRLEFGEVQTQPTNQPQQQW